MNDFSNERPGRIGLAIVVFLLTGSVLGAILAMFVPGC